MLNSTFRASYSGDSKKDVTKILIYFSWLNPLVITLPPLIKKGGKNKD